MTAEPINAHDYEAWLASPEGAAIHADLTERLSAIPLDPPRILAARRNEIA